jgi:rare lipoprotein A
MVRRLLRSLQYLCVCLGLVACVSTRSAEPRMTEASRGRIETGVASFYASKFHGRRTASGERYNSQALTAAHPSLPFGAMVRVTSLANGKTVVVRINDRGPFVAGRIIDLSQAAAQALQVAGLMRVEVEHLR